MKYGEKGSTAFFKSKFLKWNILVLSRLQDKYTKKWNFNYAPQNYWWNKENDCYLDIGKPQVIFMQCSHINRSKKSERDGNNSTNSYWEYVPQLSTWSILEEKYFSL